MQRRKEMLPEDSRLIAETHYQLGVAQGFNLDFDRAVDSLNEAIAVLAKRVDNLKAKTESVDPAKKADAFYTREAEVKEIYASNHMWQLFECSFIHDMEAVTLPSSSTPALRNYVTGTLAHIITTFFNSQYSDQSTTVQVVHIFSLHM